MKLSKLYRNTGYTEPQNGVFFQFNWYKISLKCSFTFLFVANDIHIITLHISNKQLFLNVRYFDVYIKLSMRKEI